MIETQITQIHYSMGEGFKQFKEPQKEDTEAERLAKLKATLEDPSQRGKAGVFNLDDLKKLVPELGAEESRKSTQESGPPAVVLRQEDVDQMLRGNTEKIRRDPLSPEAAESFARSLKVGDEVEILGEEEGRWKIVDLNLDKGMIRVSQQSSDGTMHLSTLERNQWVRLFPIAEAQPHRKETMADSEEDTKDFILLKNDPKITQFLDAKLAEYMTRLGSQNKDRVLDARMKLAVLGTLRNSGTLDPAALWESMRVEYSHEPNARDKFDNAVLVAKEYNKGNFNLEKET